MGMVNRTSYQGSTTLFKDSWEPAIQDLIDLPAEAFIELETTYEEASKKLDIHVHSEFLTDLTESYNICVFIIESGIISPQKNDLASIGPTPNWMDYEHKHMLRKSLNGSWGELLADQPNTGEIMTKDYSLTLDNNWDPDNVGVIAIIIDSQTYEVLQAEETHIH